jgi:hypothetical protein
VTHTFGKPVPSNYCLKWVADISGITVSTVHRAQGGERKVILFDPVMGSNSFLTGREGRRLINVALSRAQALLYVFASAGDLRNPHLADVSNCLGRKDLQRTPLFCELVNHPDFPWILQGQVFGYFGMKLAFKEFINEQTSFVTKEVATQQRRRFAMDGARTCCGDPDRCPLHCSPNKNPRSQCIA